MVQQEFIAPIEVWTPITAKSVEGVRPFYWISDLGRVFNTNINRFVPQFPDGKRGYLLVTLATDHGNVTKSVHRILMLEFVGPDPDPKKDEVDHISGDKTKNTIYDLEWVSGSENITRAYDNGLMPSGEDSPISILSNDDVRQVCLMLQNGIDKREICTFLRSKGIAHPYGEINSIYTRRTWKRISKDYVFYNYDVREPVFTEQEIHLICKLLESKLPYSNIISQLGYDYDSLSEREKNNMYQAISRIKCGHAFKEISSQYNIDHDYSNNVYTDTEIHLICKRLEEGASVRQILIELGHDVHISQDRLEYYKYTNPIYKIKNRAMFTEISKNYNF